MLSWTLRRGFIQWEVDGKTYSLSELRDMQYCLTFENWNSLKAEFSKIEDANVRSVLLYNLNLIYQITFQVPVKNTKHNYTSVLQVPQVEVEYHMSDRVRRELLTPYWKSIRVQKNSSLEWNELIKSTPLRDYKIDARIERMTRNILDSDITHTKFNELIPAAFDEVLYSGEYCLADCIMLVRSLTMERVQVPYKLYPWFCTYVNYFASFVREWREQD